MELKTRHTQVANIIQFCSCTTPVSKQQSTKGKWHQKLIHLLVPSQTELRVDSPKISLECGKLLTKMFTHTGCSVFNQASCMSNGTIL